jgi:hypothetical protein
MLVGEFYFVVRELRITSFEYWLGRKYKMNCQLYLIASIVTTICFLLFCLDLPMPKWLRAGRPFVRASALPFPNLDLSI